MTERTLAPPHPYKRLSQEQREIPMQDRIWHGTDVVVANRFQDAKTYLEQQGRPSTAEHVANFAYARQLSLLENTDTDSLTTSQLAIQRLALAVLNMPGAAKASAELQSFKKSSPDYIARQYTTLANFNATLGNAIAYLPQSMLPGFSEQLGKRGEKIIENQWRLPSFSTSELQSLLKGAEREIGIRRAVEAELPDNWEIRPATPAEDAQGTDMVATDQEHTTLRLDVKAQGSFNKLIEKMLDEGDLTTEAAKNALESGFVYKKMKSDRQKRICAFNADIFPKRGQFEYQNTSEIFDFIKERMKEEKTVQRLQKLGKSAIIN